MTAPIWLEIARELEAIAQSGLAFSPSAYDQERYDRIREIAAEIMSTSSNIATEDLLFWNRNEMGYATPKIDVRAVIFDGDLVLLGRENSDGGRWTLPGGWADVNTTPSESVVREVREETGYESRALRLLAVLDRDRQGHTPTHPYHVYKMFFHCEITGGLPTPNHESSECAFFPVSALPELSVARTLPSQIVRFHAKVSLNDPTTDWD